MPAPRCHASVVGPLRSELADPRRPVRKRGSWARPMARPAARPEEVVARAADEERSAPVGEVARVSDVLARDPHRVAVDCCGTVVTPARTDRIRELLALVAREPVVRRGSRAACDDVPRT